MIKSPPPLVIVGSKWSGNNIRFRILNTVEIDNQIWVHYIKDDINNPLEYSCHLESFLSRFTRASNE